MKSRISAQTYLFPIFFCIFIFQDVLLNYCEMSFFSLFDEFVAVLCLVLIIIVISHNNFRLKTQRDWIKILIALLCLLCCGILSNFITGYQNAKYVLLDILTCSKFYLAFFCAVIVFPNGISVNTQKVLAAITKVLITVFFVLTIHELVFEPFFSIVSENGLKAVGLFYSNVTYLAAYGIMLLLMLFVTRAYQRHFHLLLAEGVFVVFATLRSKAMGFVFIAAVFFLLLNNKSEKTAKKRLLMVAPLGIAGALFVAWDKIILYFFTAAHFSPRKILLENGLRFACNYFPVGTGYGTFCSVASLLNISPIYNQIGYNYFECVYDMFWGCIFGQFGFIGTICFLFTIWKLLMNIKKLQKHQQNYFFAAFFALLYLCISSIGECSFFSPYSVGYGFVIGIVFGLCNQFKNRNERSEDEKNTSYQ